MLNSIYGLNIWLRSSLLQINGDANLTPCHLPKTAFCAYKPESKGKSAKLEHSATLPTRPATFRPMDDTLLYEPSADCQLPMYNAAADQRVTTADRSRTSLPPESGLLPQPTRLTLD
jgi:hypothetical protein